MPWIRFDCSILDDDFVINELNGGEFKAWALFLLRVKAQGARGSVPITSLRSLSRNWNVPESEIVSMLQKAGQKIEERNGRWYVRNWRKYQEDYRNKSAYPENVGDGTDATTITTTSTGQPQDNHPTEEKIVYTRESAANIKELLEKDFILNPDETERENFIREVRKLIIRENEDRSNNPFRWTPTAKTFESDMKNLLYKLSKDQKKSILENGYTVLGDKINWCRWVLLGIEQMLRASRKTRIATPYGFVMYLIQIPQEIINGVREEGLGGSIRKIMEADK